MAEPAEPRFADLTENEIRAILARNRIGRLAFSYRDQVEIHPLHYVYDGDWLFGRTSAGEKLASLRRNWWVAFNVDEVSGPFDWHSVMVRGGFYLLSESDAADEQALRERALARIREAAPEALTAGDPVPFRSVLFGIAIQELTGRSATTQHASTAPDAAAAE